MIGKRYGRLTVTDECDLETPDSNGNRRGLVCTCDCGNEIITTRKALMGGLKSCGCLLSETAREKVRTGTLTHTDGTQLSAIREDRPANRNSKSGIKGVYYKASEDRWIAKIGVQGKTITIGRYATAEEAAAARKEAEEKYHAPLRKKARK